MFKTESLLVLLGLAILLALHVSSFPYMPFYGGALGKLGKFGKFGAGFGGIRGYGGYGGIGAYKGFYRPVIYKPYPFKWGFSYGYPYTFVY